MPGASDRIFEFRLATRSKCAVFPRNSPGELLYYADDQDRRRSGIGADNACGELIPGTEVSAIWDVGSGEPETARRSRFYASTTMLLAKLPPPHIAPLKKGGIRFFKGPPSVGGYYRQHSSTVHVNVGVNPVLFPVCLLHEVGHLVHFEVNLGAGAKAFTDIGWLQLGPFRLRKFWNGSGSFLTPYSATSPEEDFAEHYGAFAAGLFSHEEWLEIGFGKPLACPACGAPSFALDPNDAMQGICGVCDTLYSFNGRDWIARKHDVVGEKARQRGIPWPPTKPT